MQAGNAGFFKKECNLPIGTSLILAHLAAEIVGMESVGMRSKDTDNRPEMRRCPGPPLKSRV